MMISCPRCGFQQPQDQYCAQCGVNMHTFRPREKSFFKKMTENVGVQIAVLVLIAAVSGSYFIRGSGDSKFAKSERTNGARTTLKTTQSASTANDLNNEKEALSGGLTNKEITLPAETDSSLEATQPSSASLPKAPLHQLEAATAKSGDTDDSTQKASTNQVLFKLTYAEVSRDVLQRWISDSSNLGLYQNLQEYSAGILPDFTKRGDKILQYLKTTEKNLSVGQIETNVSGKMTDDGSQVIGFSVNYDLKSFENGTVRGAITVNRNGRQGRDRFPAEFDLPKGSAFFLVDSLTPQSLIAERNELNMAPFQIFKSNDFMTQNSKFVILIEPVVK